ncbi:MAG TPA: DUF1521 domain-containing protein, partial [Thermoanaerobaculia bacterium]|nr:DUF1521 domain-containing protein [Thermoanaerobaculia bacterium]
MSISLTSLSYNSSSNNSGAQALDLGSLGKVLVDTAATAMALSFLKGIDGLFERGGQNVFHHGCGCSCDPDLNTLPAPDPMFSSAPAGKGLETSPEGWPPGAVKTAGGYVIVAEGSCNWSIYAPGQKCGDTPMTRVHGDPHVSEKDGTRWDFTKDSDFVLPDGTRIFCNTSSETGQSVTTGLTITNGADRVEISGVNGHPQVGEVTRDGYEWRAAHNQQ